jgi:hypothetical protein
MTRTRWFLAFVLVLSNLPVFAQKADEEEAAREKQRRQAVLAESIIAESRELRLPENRAVVYAKIGNRVWDIDRERAGNLFQDAITELLAAQAEAELERVRGRQSELLTGQNTRPQVLQAIAARDADFALRSLYRTRPAAVERAVAGVSTKDSKIRNSPGNDMYLAQNELNLEQGIARLAADQNPEKAVALLRAVMKKGITGEALQLLRKVHEKDPSAAAELGSEVTAQLMKKNLMVSNQPDYAGLQAAFSFLNDHVRQRPASDKSFKFAPAEMRSLADRLITFFLDRNNLAALSYAQQMVPIAEEMRPDAVEKLKELGTAAYGRNGLHAYNPDPEVTRLLNGETPVEEMLAAAPKLPVEHRQQIYQNAANRLVAAGNETRARQVIDDNFAEDDLTNARDSLNWYYVHQLINQGKYGEAEALIGEFPDGNRFSALISLANSVYQKNPDENRAQALAILQKAAAGLPTRPETSNEMQQSMQLIAAYTQIEPAEAFRMFDSLVPQINELAEASAVISEFQGNYYFRHGEMLIIAGNSFGISFDGSMFRGLAQKDFDRTLALIGSFSRRELRIGLKQQLLEAL